MIGRRIVLGCQPMVVAVVVGLRLFVAVKVTVQMPFPSVASIVTSLFQNFRDRDFARSQVILAARWNPTKNAISIGGSSRQNRRP